MTSANTLTGRLGKHLISSATVARITQWSVNPTLASTNEWGDSDSEGYTNRSAGRKDATFDTEGKFATDTEVYDVFQPGDGGIVSSLWLNASLYWAFPLSLNTDFNLTVNVDTEEVIGWTSSWGADGIYYYPGQAEAPSYSLP